MDIIETGSINAPSAEELATLADYLQKHGQKEIIRFLQRYARNEHSTQKP